MTNSREPCSGRGNAETRRRRKRWLLAEFGDGVTVACSHCPAVLTFETLTVDRVTPGVDGGRYERANIRPSCLPCAGRQGARLARRPGRITTDSCGTVATDS